jgi:hypothetical protein
MGVDNLVASAKIATEAVRTGAHFDAYFDSRTRCRIMPGSPPAVENVNPDTGELPGNTAKTVRRIHLNESGSARLTGCAIISIPRLKLLKTKLREIVAGFLRFTIFSIGKSRSVAITPVPSLDTAVVRG